MLLPVQQWTKFLPYRAIQLKKSQESNKIAKWSFWHLTLISIQLPLRLVCMESWQSQWEASVVTLNAEVLWLSQPQFCTLWQCTCIPPATCPCSPFPKLLFELSQELLAHPSMQPSWPSCLTSYSLGWATPTKLLCSLVTDLRLNSVKNTMNSKSMHPK